MAVPCQRFLHVWLSVFTKYVMVVLNSASALHLHTFALCVSVCLSGLSTSVFGFSFKKVPEILGGAAVCVDVLLQHGDLWGLTAQVSLSLDILCHL